MRHYLTVIITAVLGLIHGHQQDRDVSIAMKCYDCPRTSYCGELDMESVMMPRTEWMDCFDPTLHDKAIFASVKIHEAENFACLWHPRNGCILAIRDEDSGRNPDDQYCYECDKYCPCGKGIPLHIALKQLDLFAVLLISTIICNSNC